MIIKRPHIFTSVAILYLSFFIIVLGGTANFIAIQNNKGLMPVLSSYQIEGNKHFSFQDQTEVNKYFFVDRFNINHFIYSIGDFILFLGISGFIYATINLCIDVKNYKKNGIKIQN